MGDRFVPVLINTIVWEAHTWDSLGDNIDAPLDEIAEHLRKEGFDEKTIDWFKHDMQNAKGVVGITDDDYRKLIEEVVLEFM